MRKVMKNKTFYDFWVYILTNFNNSTFYIGVTNNLERRLYEHKNEMVNSFTKKYKLKKIVYYEHFVDVNDAIAREKQLKNWHRGWKLNLIKSVNPEFKDLSKEWNKK